MAVLIVLTLGLVRQVKRLFRSVADFNEEVMPALLGMQQDAERARERAERLQGQAER